MELRRGGWIGAGLVVVLAGWSVLLAAPLALVGAAGLGGWLLAHQYAFGRALDATVTDLDVTQAPARTRVVAGETTPVTLAVTASGPVPVDLTVAPGLPASVDPEVVTLELERGDRRAEATIHVTWPVAGSVSLEPATVTGRDDHGLFVQSVPAGGGGTVVVEPRTPQDIHVGTGGEPVTASFGEHATSRPTSGFEPAGVRQYVPGDPFRRIDWKATARLGEPHVQEVEGESERRTVLVVDHGGHMATGEPGTRQLDLAREVALAFVDAARDDGDPLGCATVADAGLTGSFEPRMVSDHYEAIRTHLAGLEATGGDASDGPRTAAALATRRRERLADDTAFGHQLGPFFERGSAYVEQVADRPLYQTVRDAAGRLGSAGWLVLFTDDRNRAEIQEAVRAARLASAGVLVFLTPAVLFEADAVADLERAYERYADFEAFRQDLSGEGVWAFEVGPGDRLEAILAAGRAERRAREVEP